jgi:hypothetical protein
MKMDCVPIVSCPDHPATCADKECSGAFTMISSIASAVSSPAVAQPNAVAQPTTAPQSSSTTKTARVPTDTVSISSAAVAMLKEAIETPVQTAKEASGGDLQAQRLLAKEAQKLT